MCALTEPPTPIPAPWLWHDGALWIAFVVWLAVALGGGLGLAVMLRHVPWVKRRWLPRLALLAMEVLWLSSATGLGIETIIVLPFQFRLGSWYAEESARLAAAGCLRTQLFATDDQLQAAMSGWTIVVQACLAIAFLSFSILATCASMQLVLRGQSKQQMANG